MLLMNSICVQSNFKRVRIISSSSQCTRYCRFRCYNYPSRSCLHMIRIPRRCASFDFLARHPDSSNFINAIAPTSTDTVSPLRGWHLELSIHLCAHVTRTHYPKTHTIPMAAKPFGREPSLFAYNAPSPLSCAVRFQSGTMCGVCTERDCIRCDMQVLRRTLRKVSTVVGCHRLTGRLRWFSRSSLARILSHVGR